MQNVSETQNEMSVIIFWEYKKNISKCHQLKLFKLHAQHLSLAQKTEHFIWNTHYTKFSVKK